MGGRVKGGGWERVGVAVGLGGGRGGWGQSVGVGVGAGRSRGIESDGTGVLPWVPVTFFLLRSLT